jgi:hypothetical protein
MENRKTIKNKGWQRRYVQRMNLASALPRQGHTFATL